MACGAILYFLIPFGICSQLAPCAAVTERSGSSIRYEASQIHMGTTFRLVFYAADDKSASSASAAAFARIEQLNQIMSDYLDDSELTRLSESAGGPPVAISQDLFHILQRSVELSQISEGAFDITIGPVVRLWRRARRQRKLPETEQIRDYLQRVGYQKIRLDPKERTAQLLHSPMRLDLGGIAKGYACQEALKVLQSHGIHAALVDGGGDVAVSGPPPGQKGWEIQVQTQIEQPATTLHLCHGAVATSGDATQFVEIDGTRYSHIVDPRTGIGLTNRLQVTVIAKDGATADALASAISVLGPEKGIRLADSFESVACFISHIDADDKIHTYQCSKWNRYTQESKHEVNSR